MSPRWVLLAFLLSAFAAGACGDDGNDERAQSPDTATSNVTATATPGEFIVYSTEVRQVDDGTRGWPVRRVAVYHLATKGELSSFEVGGPPDYPLQIVLAGDRIVVNLERRIVSFARDGSDARDLRTAAEGGSFIGIDASPDGTQIAVTEQTAAHCPPGQQQCLPYDDITEVSVIDVATGDERPSLPQSDPAFEGFVGQLALVTWRADGTGFVISGYTYSEAPGGLATVRLDGGVTLHDYEGYPSVSPNGQYVADGAVTFCDLSVPPERHEVRIRDLATSEVANTVRDDEQILQTSEWSPGGDELLYRGFSLQEATPAPAGCPRVDEATVEWHVVPVDGSAPRPVAGVDAARDAWYGPDRLTFRCEGEAVDYAYCIGPDGTERPVDVYAGDTLIVTGEGFQQHEPVLYPPA